MDEENRREFYRACLLIPARVERLDSEAEELVSKGLGRALLLKGVAPGPVEELLEHATPGTDQECLLRCMQLINNKLDFLIERLLHPEGQPPEPLVDIIELSGSGLKFQTKEVFEPGEILRLGLIIPESFQYRMELVAEVLRCDSSRAGRVVAARIAAIEEENRDAIIKAVFRKQRWDIRRDRNENEEEGG
ncbi:MAG: PilZ domain-containing protein [Desulfobacteraceae bacterium]